VLIAAIVGPEFLLGYPLRRNPERASTLIRIRRFSFLTTIGTGALAAVLGFRADRDGRHLPHDGSGPPVVSGPTH
jgi:hypothetical protein